jgi:hypothetical protein
MPSGRLQRLHGCGRREHYGMVSSSMGFRMTVAKAELGLLGTVLQTPSQGRTTHLFLWFLCFLEGKGFTRTKPCCNKPREHLALAFVYTDCLDGAALASVLVLYRPRPARFKHCLVFSRLSRCLRHSKSWESDIM